MNVLEKTKEYFNDMVELRRHFHTYPESGPAEQLETLKFIESKLAQMEIPFVRVPNGGIFAFINGAKDGKTILLRSDTDALPILEDSQNLVKEKICISKNKGVMHACGHDGHMAMLLTEARILKDMEKELKGSVILMFEEGEEGFLNIDHLCTYIENEKLKIDSCYSTHVRWDIPSGKIACCDDGVMSGIYFFHLTIHGESGHGSRPDLAKSVLDCFVQIYTAMQMARMKYATPDYGLTWSIGQLDTGTAMNVIPDYLKCGGSLRFFNLDEGRKVWSEFKRIIDSVCKLNYCTYEILIDQFFPPVINDPNCKSLFCNSVKEGLGEEALYKCKPWMASETFSYMSCMYPSVLSFTGIKNEELGSGANHHTAKFDIDEQGLLAGAAGAVCYALNFLNNPPDTSSFEPMKKSMTEFLKMLKEA